MCVGVRVCVRVCVWCERHDTRKIAVAGTGMYVCVCVCVCDARDMIGHVTYVLCHVRMGHVTYAHKMSDILRVKGSCHS